MSVSGPYAFYGGSYQLQLPQTIPVQGLPELTQALLDRGVDLNAADKEKRTPVMHALLCGNPGLALQLLERGAEIDLKDKDDKTALLYATEKLNEEVCAEPQIYPPLPFRTLPVEGVKPWVLTLLLGASRRRGGLFPPAQLFLGYLFQAIKIQVGAVWTWDSAVYTRARLYGEHPYRAKASLRGPRWSPLCSPRRLTPTLWCVTRL